jgi:AAA domain-containing protein
MITANTMDPVQQLEAFMKDNNVIDETVARILPTPVDAAEWIKEALGEPDPILDGACDTGTKTIIAGPSKCRKSFFALQLGVSLAGNEKRFLHWSIPKRRNVLILQIEITEIHFQKRVKGMVSGLGIGRKALKGYLHIINGRGCDLNEVNILELIEIIQELEIEVVIIDPVYKLLSDENSAEAVKPLLSAFDVICKETGAAVIYVHHYGKGRSGDREVMDRSVGSGVISRDIDCGIYLTPHKNDGLIVLEQVARSYPPQEAQSLLFNITKCCFELDDTPPIVKTSSNSKRNGVCGSELTAEDALQVLTDGPLSKSIFKEKLQKKGATDRGATAMIETLVIDGRIRTFKEKKMHGANLHGLPGHINKIEVEEAEETQTCHV